MPSFQEMFRDYDKELADVERNRVDQVKTAERDGEAERQGLMQQLATAEGEQAMWIQSKYENSFGNEDNKIRGINEQADQDKQIIEDDRKANEQQRVKGTGLEFETGPASEQSPPANVNAFAAVPPDPPAPPQEPPKEAAKESEQAQERSAFMRDLVDGAKGAAGEVMFNLAAIGVALTTQVQSILETFDHEHALAAMNQEKAAVTRDGSDIKPDSMVVNPPVQEGELDEKHDSVARYQLQEHQEAQADMQSAIDAEKNTPALVQNPSEERVVTHVFGVELQPPPPPPPPPPANDNKPLTK